MNINKHQIHLNYCIILYSLKQFYLQLQWIEDAFFFFSKYDLNFIMSSKRVDPQ